MPINGAHDFDSVIQSYCHTVIRLYGNTVKRSYSRTVTLSNRHTVVRSHCQTVTRSYGHTVKPSHGRTVIQSNRHTVKRSYGHTVKRKKCHHFFLLRLLITPSLRRLSATAPIPSMLKSETATPTGLTELPSAITMAYSKSCLLKASCRLRSSNFNSASARRASSSI